MLQAAVGGFPASLKPLVHGGLTSVLNRPPLVADCLPFRLNPCDCDRQLRRLDDPRHK